MIIGAIDVGSNSVKYLVASVKNGHVRPIAQRSEITRLSRGLERTGAISREAQRRTIAALRTFLPEMADLGAEKIVAVGTEAFRLGRNGRAFAELCFKKSGAPVRVISAKEEAALSFLGATSGRREPRLVAIDIGGGSTEIMLGKAGRLESDVSLPLGAVRLTEKHFASDPPALAERLSLVAEVRDGLERLPKTLRRAAQSKTVLGIGGTCVNVARIAHPEEEPGRREIRLETLESILDRLADLPLARRRRVPGIDAARADIIVAGGRILAEALKKFGAGAFAATPRGLRWGLVLSEA